jgi:hypothetical protein
MQGSSTNSMRDIAAQQAEGCDRPPADRILMVTDVRRTNLTMEIAW